MSQQNENGFVAKREKRDDSNDFHVQQRPAPESGNSQSSSGSGEKKKQE
ncbi:MAG: hypothetical protein RRZ38_13715 [Hafnia sp.]